MAKKEPKADDKIVGANVRRFRLARAMSQEKLGDALGLTFQQVQKYEKGTNRIGASRLVQIAGVFKCRAADLLDGTGNGKAATIIDDPVRTLGSTTVGIDMAAAFVKLSTKVQRAIVGVCEAASAG